MSTHCCLNHRSLTAVSTRQAVRRIPSGVATIARRVRSIRFISFVATPSFSVEEGRVATVRVLGPHRISLRIRRTDGGVLAVGERHVAGISIVVATFLVGALVVRVHDRNLSLVS